MQLGMRGPMSFFRRFIHSKPSHDEWLAAHPGKGTAKAPPPAIDEAEQQRMRAQMEGELDQQRADRKQE